jgi:hypothetical protein
VLIAEMNSAETSGPGFERNLYILGAVHLPYRMDLVSIRP